MNELLLAYISYYVYDLSGTDKNIVCALFDIEEIDFIYEFLRSFGSDSPFE